MNNPTDLLFLIRSALSNGGKPALAGVTLQGKQEIRGRIIECALDFTESSFESGLRFFDCTFKEDVSLIAASTKGRVEFENCVFEKQAVFRPRDASHLAVNGTHFKKGVEISVPENSDFVLDASACIFGGNCEIKALGHNQPGASQVEISTIILNDSKIEKESSLEIGSVRCKKLALSSIHLADKCSLYISSVDPGDLYMHDIRTMDRANVIFFQTDLSRARFSGTNIEKFSFTDVTWRTIKGLPILCEDPEAEDTLAAATASSGHASEKTEENYRQLVINYEAKRNYAMAEGFHLREMELMWARTSAGMQKKIGRAGKFLNAYFLYKILSLYGTSYKRALLALAMIILGFSSAFMMTGIKPRDSSSPINYQIDIFAKPSLDAAGQLSEDFVKSLAMTLSIATLQKDRQADPEGDGGAILSSALIIFASAQTALVLFALRRKFRRASI